MKHNKIILIVCVLCIVAALLYSARIFNYLGTDALVAAVQSLGIYAPIGFFLIVTIAMVFLLPFTPFALASGVLFGPIKGGLIMVAASLIGSCICFYITRRLGKAPTERFMHKYRKAEKYYKAIGATGFRLVLFSRLMPYIPFGAFTVIFALSTISFSSFLWGSVAGLLPSTLILSAIGSSASLLQATQVIILGTLLLALSGIPFLLDAIVKLFDYAKNMQKKRQKKN